MTGSEAASRSLVIGALFGAWSLELGIWSLRLQADGMPRVKTARWPVNSLPAWRPFAGVMIVGRRVQSQSGNNCKGVTVPRVDGDPFAKAAFAVAAELG